MNIRVRIHGIIGLICGLVFLGDLVNAQNGETETYYVAADGSDANSGTERQPFRTLSRGVRALGPGHTLYVKNGTYTVSRRALARIPSGISWANSVTIAAYPGHSPVIVKSGQDAHTLTFTNNRYLVVKGFLIDGTNAVDGIKITSESSEIAHHIRIQDSEIAYAKGSGIFVTNESDGNEFINLKIHSNGTTHLHHGIYIRSSGNLVEDCSIDNNKGWGVHVYGSGEVNNNTIRNNEVYDNGRGGIILTSGSSNQAYDNDIWNNMHGIRIDYGALNTQVVGNTIYGNARGGIYIGRGSNKAFIDSNDIHGNHGPSITDEGVSTKILP